ASGLRPDRSHAVQPDTQTHDDPHLRQHPNTVHQTTEPLRNPGPIRTFGAQVPTHASGGAIRPLSRHPFTLSGSPSSSLTFSPAKCAFTSSTISSDVRSAGCIQI